MKVKGGSLVFWRRLAVRTDKAKLEEALQNAGIEGVALRERTPKEALKAAMHEIFPCKGSAMKTHLVRPVRKDQAFTVVDERKEAEESNEYGTAATFEVDKDGAITLRNGWVNHDTQIDLHKRTKEFLRDLPAEAVAAAMIAFLGRKGATSLRDGGGLYFLPAAHEADWRSMCMAVAMAAKEGRHEICTMPLECDFQTAHWIKEAVVQRLTEEAGGIASDVEKGMSRKDALDRRAARLDELRAEARMYEDILEESLTGVRTVIDGASSAVAVARAGSMGSSLGDL